MTEDFNKFGEDLSKNVPGFIAVAISEIKTGICYYSLSALKSFDVELAASFNLEVVKAKLNAISALELNMNIDNIMITLDSQIHIVEISPNNDFFVYLAVDSTKANLGMIKSLFNKYKKEINLS